MRHLKPSKMSKQYKTGQALLDDDTLVVKNHYGDWESINNGEPWSISDNAIEVSENDILKWLLKESYKHSRDDFGQIEPNTYNNGYIHIIKQKETGEWWLFGKGTTTTENARNLGMATLDADRAVTALNISLNLAK